VSVKTPAHGERQGDLTTSTKVWTPEEIRRILASAKVVDWGWFAWTGQYRSRRAGPEEPEKGGHP
jgi:hypothetical protein